MPTLRLELARGRLRLSFDALMLGDDVQLAIYGGDAHLGSVALATADGVWQVVGIPQHREAEWAPGLACRLAKKLDCAVGVCMGIHYDKLNIRELPLILRMLEDGIDRLANKILLWRQGKCCASLERQTNFQTTPDTQ